MRFLSYLLLFIALFAGTIVSANESTPPPHNESLIDPFTGLGLTKTPGGIISIPLSVSIPSGHVGIQYKWGAMQPYFLEPGFHWYDGWSTSTLSIVEVRVQTDVIENVKCMTNENIPMLFEKIEVMNLLLKENVPYTVYHYTEKYDKYWIHDKVLHQINVICSKHSAHQLAIDIFQDLDDMLVKFLSEEQIIGKTGIQIKGARLTKPIPPKAISDNYLRLASEKTEKKVIVEQQAKEKEVQTLNLITAEGEAKKRQAEDDAKNRRELAAMENAKAIADIENKMRVEAAKASDLIIKNTAEANSFKNELETADLAKKHGIKGYTQVEIARTVYNNAKFFGEIPAFLAGGYMSNNGENIPFMTSNMANIVEGLKGG